jgi:hypothetical protein
MKAESSFRTFGRAWANSMIDGVSKVRNDFFTTLKGLEPSDVAVLDLFSMPEIAEFTNEQRSRMTRVLRERRVEGFNEDALTVSLEALQASRCVTFGASNVWRLMAYGRLSASRSDRGAAFPGGFYHYRNGYCRIAILS